MVHRKPGPGKPLHTGPRLGAGLEIDPESESGSKVLGGLHLESPGDCIRTRELLLSKQAQSTDQLLHSDDSISGQHRGDAGQL